MKNNIAFTKMHALGNDFMVVNNLDLSFKATPAHIQQLSHRQTGIGFDQALLIEPSKQADYFCRILNADGSEAEQCGNGLRCVALYLKTKVLNTPSSLTLETKAGLFPIRFCDDGDIEVNMGHAHTPINKHMLFIHGDNRTLHTVSLGNPHCLLLVPSLESAPLNELGSALNQHTLFPQGVNVGFLEIEHPHLAHLRTYERGAGLTLACGSNACAAAMVGIHEGLLASPVDIAFSLGKLTLTYHANDQTLLMKGPAHFVFEGVLTSAPQQ